MQLELIKAPRVIPHRMLYRTTKRILDLSLCIFSLPFSLPLFALCALAIRLDSPGPVIFVQERLGKGGKPFQILKFRTMTTVVDNEACRNFMQAYVRGEVPSGADGSQVFKPATEAYITRVGRLLRKASLDELPQLINVLKGEMSLVGPRPNVPWEVEAYRPWHHERMEVLPGITGLAQVRGRSSIDFTSLVRSDIEYVEKQSFRLDLQILWQTFVSVWSGRGAK